MQTLTRVLIALFLLWSPAWADDDDTVVVGQTVTAANPCAAYLICQGFEGVGYDNSETWTEVNQGAATINEDYTDVSPEGDQALSVISGADNGTNDGTWESFTAQSTVYGYFQLYIWSLSGSYSEDLVNIQTGAGAQIFAIYAASGAHLYVWDGSERSSAYDLTPETTHHIWWEYSTGAGDGVIKVYADTSTTKPAATISVTNGTYANDAARIFLATSRLGSIVFDKVRVKTTDIGSNPD